MTRAAVLKPREASASATRAEAAASEAPPDRRLVLLLAAAIAAGILLRILAAVFVDVRDDGGSYAAMGVGLLHHGDFWLPYGDVTTSWPRGAEPTHHYPPLYPAYLALWYAALGFGYAQTKAAALAMSLAALAVVYLCTRDVLRDRPDGGHVGALVVTALLAVEPHLVWSTGTNFSENAVLLLFTATLWAILKSLDKPVFILLAGVFAAAAYLTRASLGPFFVIAGVAGVAWRLRHRGVGGVTNPWYLGAVAIFGTVFIAWAARNLHHFGWPNWQTSSYTAWVIDYAAAHPARTLEGALWKIPFFILLFLVYASFFAPEVRRSLKRARGEAESALWLAIGLVFALSWIMTTVFWVYEFHDKGGGLFWLDNHRYIVIAQAPLFWAVVRNADFESRGFRLRVAAFLLVGLLVASAALAAPLRYPEHEAIREILSEIEPDHSITVECWITKYSLYPHLGVHVREIARMTCGQANPVCFDSDWLIIRARGEIPAYEYRGSWRVNYLDGSSRTVGVYEKVGENAPERVGPRACHSD